MKTYRQVYTQSRNEVLEQRKTIINEQKEAIVNVLKENYMIVGKMSEQKPEVKAEMAKRLAEYWSPKTGIKDAGIRLLNENMITLTKNSTAEDIKLYISKRVKKNLVQITECFKAGRADVVVESLNNEIQPMIGKKLKDKVVLNTVWDIVGDRIKNGLA